MVCSDEGSLGAEMELLAAVHEIVADAAHAHVMVYAADPARSPRVGLHAPRGLLFFRALRRMCCSCSQVLSHWWFCITIRGGLEQLPVQAPLQASVGRSLLQQQQRRARKQAAQDVYLRRQVRQPGDHTCHVLLIAPDFRSTAASSRMHGWSIIGACCLLQVKLLEGLILALNLIIAVLVGSCMLNGLGTPTRFETPKDSTQRD